MYLTQAKERNLSKGAQIKEILWSGPDLHAKNLSDLTGKIEWKSGLPTTWYFLLKNFTFFSVFWEIFTS